MRRDVSRRRFLQAGAALGAAAAVTPMRTGWALGAAAPTKIRQPGSLPNPRRPAGTDLLPQIEHIVVLMQENHSFDNYLGMLGRGDGFHLDASHRPTDANPDPDGTSIRAYQMANACQSNDGPSQSWNDSHISFADGHNDGFVRASGPIAMGYFTAEQIPFYYSLAKAFPLCDRWFCSVLAQTYPNRRFLLTGTAYGAVSTEAKYILAPSPPNGTIYDQLNAHGITWRDYYVDLPQPGLFKSVYDANMDKVVHASQFAADAAAGTLPAVSWVDASSNTSTEEDPQDIQLGEAFVAPMIQAAMQGPAWEKTLLIWTYDEHGGYYDHVPPPPAVKPDDITPDIQVPPDQPGAYDRLGFRVPSVVISPYARRNYVSHVVHDHTSILKLIETKWNLPALTFRDANADNLLDSLDLHASPAFREPPHLATPGLTAVPSNCAPGQPGVIPPPSAVLHSRVRAGT